MNISNINTENGIIYFHANSVPYHLENMNNELALQKIIHIYDGELIEENELSLLELSDYPHLIENYILELKSDWVKIEESDTDNYLTEIDSAFFDSEFCKVYYNEICKHYFFIIKINNEKIIIYLDKDGEIQISVAHNLMYFAKTLNLVDSETANNAFQTMYRESESYLATIAKEILIRSHQDFLYSKKQVVVI